MSAKDLLMAVADALKARGHEAETPSYPCGRSSILCLFVGEKLVARSSDGNVFIESAQVFDGHKHVVPKGCDVSTVTPGSRYATVDRIAAAIEHRMAARARSLPVPRDPSAIVREP